MDKKSCRLQCRRVWQDLLADPGATRALCEAFEHWLQNARLAGRLLASVPLGDELDLLGLALQYSPTVFAPVTLAEGMEFRRIRRREESRPGFRNIPGAAPRAELLELPLNASDLVLIPSLGASRAGYRLGRGAGYYDRWRTHLEPARRLAVLPHLLAELDFPVEEHDLRLSMIVTEEGLIDLEKS